MKARQWWAASDVRLMLWEAVSFSWEKEWNC